MAQQDKKNIDILPKSAARKMLSDVVAPKRTVAAEQMFRPPMPRVRPQKSLRVGRIAGWWKYIIVFVVGLMGWIVFAVGTSRMEIRIVPRENSVPIDKVFPVTRKLGETGKLFIRTIAVPDSREGIFEGRIAIVPVEKRAKGTVTIFNKSSQAPQVLMATTRLAAPDGKIYRIPRAITVPGYHVENKEIIPGSKDVEVVADKAGEEYNLGLTDFTLPGFAGSPKFNTVFARSKTPIQGGFVGSEKSVSPEDMEKGIIRLRAEADAAAQSLLLSKMPENNILIRSSVESVAMDQEVQFIPGQGDNQFKLILKTESRGAMIDQDQLLSIFSAVPLPKPVRSTNLNDLTYALSGYSYEGTDGQIKISGEARIESVASAEDIARAVVEKKLVKSKDILTLFNQLSSVEIRFSPFWFKYPPSDQKRIDIIFPTR